MFWVAFKGYNNGNPISLGFAEQLEAEAFGMHGYPTATLAKAHPNAVNLVDKAQVNAWIIANNDITGNPGKDLANAAKNLPGVGSIDDAINWLKDNWESIGIRIGETLVGLVLLYIGLKAVTTPNGQAPVQRTAKDTAKTVHKWVVK